MTLDDIEGLAKLGVPFSSNRILALIACVRAADALRVEITHREVYESDPQTEAYDDARAALEQT